MALSLATFPIEILSAIIGHLTPLETLGRLRECGDSVLTGRLKNRGITHLEFDLLRAQSPGRIEFIRSLKLESFIVNDGSDVDVNNLKEMLHGLSSNLKILSLPIFYVGEGSILQSSEFDLDSSDFPNIIRTRHSKYLPWSVKASYPNLTSLSLKDDDTHLEDTIFLTRFLVGLPSSLTHLDLPLSSINTAAELNRLLPPNLTSLFTINDPEIAFGENQLDKLTHLKLGSHLSNEMEFVYPSHLTELELRAMTFFPRTPISCPNLTSLALTSASFPPPFVSVNQILAVTPNSLTSLTVVGFKFLEEQGDDFEFLQRPNLTRLFQDITGSNSAHMLALLQCIPNIEELMVCGGNELSEEGLKLEHFKALHGRALTQLSAPISSHLLKPHGVGCPSILEVVAPRLRELEITNDSLESIDFGMIPSTVTRLVMCTDTDVSTLHRLPSTVKHFEARYMVFDGSELPPVLIPPTPPIAANQLDSNTNAIGTPKSFDMALGSTAGYQNYTCEWRPTQLDLCPPSSSDTSVSSSIASDSASRVSASKGGQTLRLLLVPASNKFASTVNITNWNPRVRRGDSWSLPQLPESITRLTMCEPHEAPLPHLVELNIVAMNTPSLDLSLYPSLTRLTFRSLKENTTISACPPNLTYLRCEDEMSFPPSFLPLPTSLKTIVCTGAAPRPLSALKDLPNLSRLRTPKPSDVGLIDWLNLLPASMTRIKLKGKDFDLIKDKEDALKEVVQILTQRFTSLAVLSVFVPLPTKVYRVLVVGLPHVDVQGGPDNAPIREPAILATRLGHSEGTLTLPQGRQNILEWSAQARPHYLKDETVQTQLLSLSEWNDFAPLLSPETSIAMGIRLELPEEAKKVIWPLASLDLKLYTSWKNATLSSIPLPQTTLTSLSIQLTEILIDALPDSLTRLTLEGSRAGPAEIRSVLAWPRNLRHLECHIHESVLTDNLKKLPHSLEHLALSNAMNTEQVELLPPRLVYFERDDCPLGNIDEWLRFIQERKIYWITEAANVSRLTQLFGEEVALEALNGITRQ